MTFQEISKDYKNRGYSRTNKRKTKLAEYALFQKEKEGLFSYGYDAEYVYHVEGDVTLAHTNDFLKRYKKIYEDLGFDSGDKGILSYTGHLNTREFRKLARSILDEYQYKSMKLKNKNPLSRQKKLKLLAGEANDPN